MFQRADWSHGRRGGSAGKIQEAAFGAPSCTRFFDCICCSLIIWTGCSVERSRSRRYKATATAKCLPGSCLVGKMERDKKKRENGGAECSITERGISRESRTSSILQRQRRRFITLGGATFLPQPTQHMAMAARGRAGGGGGRGSFHLLPARKRLVARLVPH